MFGSKARRIKELETALENSATFRADDVRHAGEQLKAAEEVRKTLNVRCSELSLELDVALSAVTGYEGQVEAYADDLVREREINEALADENRDLVYQLQMLRALFGQLSIQVKLPSRKK